MPKMPVGTGGHVTPQPTQTCSRSSQGANHLPSNEELARLNQDLMSSMAQAHEYLEKLGYAPTDAWGEKATLSHTLLLLALSALANILQKGFQAVATILEQDATVQMANTVITNVMTRLDPVLALMDDAADRMQEASMETRMAVDRLYRMCEETRDELQRAMDGMKEEVQRQQRGSRRFPAS